MEIIAIEEHFASTKASQLRSAPQPFHVPGNYSERKVYPPGSPETFARLRDVGETRLKAMDDAGIDIQVLSAGAPGPEALDLIEGPTIARFMNDELAGIIKKYPSRFAGFAALAPQDPDVAALELERAVKDLGFKGAKMNSNVKGDYLDKEFYWPIFAAAERLGVPVYLHPGTPNGDLAKLFIDYPALAGPVWGYAADASLMAMRLICSGVFDKYPGLNIILGHLGESLPFWMWRIDNRWDIEDHANNPRIKKLLKKPGQYILNNILVTNSGMSDTAAFMCAYSKLGADRILFAVDYPFESNNEAVGFINNLSIPEKDRQKILHLNAEKYLSL